MTVQKKLLVQCSELLAQASDALDVLKALVNQVDAMVDMPEMARAYREQVMPAMTELRRPVDELEMLVDKSIWPVPTYGDLMFEV